MKELWAVAKGAREEWFAGAIMGEEGKRWKMFRRKITGSALACFQRRKRWLPDEKKL